MSLRADPKRKTSLFRVSWASGVNQEGEREGASVKPPRSHKRYDR